MAEITKPDMSVIWASGGAIIAPSPVKVQTGWTAEIPPHQWENWSQNRQDSALAYLFQHGIPEWDATTEYFSGRSVVLYQGKIYFALTNNTGINPTTSATDWQTIIQTSDFTGTNQNLVGNGYQKLPGGLILQWGGRLVPPGGTAYPVTLPIAYPNSGLQVFATFTGFVSSSVKSVGAAFLNNSTINLWNSDTSDSLNVGFFTIGR